MSELSCRFTARDLWRKSNLNCSTLSHSLQSPNYCDKLQNYRPSRRSFCTLCDYLVLNKIHSAYNRMFVQHHETGDSQDMRQWPICYSTVKANGVSPSDRYRNRWHCYRKYEQRRLAVLQQPIIWRTQTEQLVPKCLLYEVQVCFRQWPMTCVTKVPLQTRGLSHRTKMEGR